MRSKKLTALGVALLAVAGVLLAQQPSGSGEATSLADLARQQRARRMKVMQERSVRVWTNENMPKRPASEGPTAAAGMSAEPSPPVAEAGAEGVVAATPEQAPTTEAGPGAGPSSSVHDEKYYRTQMGELRTRLEMHRRQLAVLQQKQAQGQMQYYADPNKTLQEEFSRSDINKRNEEIAKMQQEIAADEQAIQGLEDQLRREGHPAGWLR